MALTQQITPETHVAHEDAFPCTMWRDCTRPAEWAVEGQCSKHEQIECLSCEPHWLEVVRYMETYIDLPHHSCGLPLANVRARLL